MKRKTGCPMNILPHFPGRFALNRLADVSLSKVAVLRLRIITWYLNISPNKKDKETT